MAPVASSHDAVAHGLTGSTLAVPAQTPAPQLSAVVHRLPSSHAVVAGASVSVQPLAGSHAPTRQGPAPGQLSSPAATQLPDTHLDWLEHASPSSQAPPSLVVPYRHLPVAATQASAVHGLPSSQFTAGPAMQVPSLHASSAVQALPSASQFTAAGACWHPAAASHESVVQTLLSSQPRAAPAAHDPD